MVFGFGKKNKPESNLEDFSAIFDKTVELGEQGNSEERLVYIDKLVQVATTNEQKVIAFNLKGSSNMFLENFKEALMWYNKTLEIDPSHMLGLVGKDTVLKAMSLRERDL